MFCNRLGLRRALPTLLKIPCGDGTPQGKELMKELGFVLKPANKSQFMDFRKVK
jgi:hypothetical protein